MFWKKDTGAVKSAKPLSPKEVIIRDIEQLAPGQALHYRLPEGREGGTLVVEKNAHHDPKDKKTRRMYLMSTEALVDGKPSGKRDFWWDSDKPKDIASWILNLEATKLTE